MPPPKKKLSGLLFLITTHPLDFNVTGISYIYLCAVTFVGTKLIVIYEFFCSPPPTLEPFFAPGGHIIVLRAHGFGPLH